MVVEALEVSEQIPQRMVSGSVDAVLDMRVWKKLSMGGLSKQSPVRLIGTG